MGINWRKLVTFISLSICTSLLPVLTEFRFCHKGPHRISELDCPGGFIAKTKLPITCKYYARTPNVSTATAKFSSDICDAGATLEVDVLTNNEDNLTTLADTLIQVQFDIDDQPMDEGDLGGKIDDDICFKECLKDWVDPETVEDEPFLNDGMTPSGSSTTFEQVALTLNKEIFLAIMDEDDDDKEDVPNSLASTRRIRPKPDPLTNDVDDGATLRIIKLLAKSMRVMVAGCAPYVEEDFFRQVVKAFIFMAQKNESVILDVTMHEYKIINSALNQCLQKRNLGFTLNGTVCDRQAKVEGIYYYKTKEYWKYRRTGYSAWFPRHNPIIEAGWNAIEFVHGYCFESFVNNIMDLHTYQVALEGLFTIMLLRHWQTIAPLKQGIFWNNVLHTQNVSITIRNLDACVIGGNSMSPFKERLKRPYYSKDSSEKKDEDSTYAPPPNIVKPGWKKSPQEYWEWYEEKGGFKGISKNFGRCINNENLEMNKDEMEDLVKSTKAASGCPVPDTDPSDPPLPPKPKILKGPPGKTGPAGKSVEATSSEETDPAI